MQANNSLVFASVKEWGDEFLTLFPHRFDYIWAEHESPGEKVKWQTESRHPLSDRLIQQGTYLYGVRFGSETQYCLLDIDFGSQYHPRQDPFAISRMVAALEQLGLVSYVACTSSYSNGLHLYFPFQRSQNSWKLAIAVSTLLENAGFNLKPGQLEVFPDPKPYSVNGKPSLFNAHRLPLQTGSYLLNTEFQPIWATQQNFVQHWQLSQARNDMSSTLIRLILKQVKRQRYGISTRAEKFINDLNTEIEGGWTGFGQTNYLLGRITMREYIFRHVLSGGQPLSGELLVQAIVDVAQSLPGYSEYCRHRHEIEHRAIEWARCIEHSHYFHYGDGAGKFKPKLPEPTTHNADLQTAIAHSPTWNQHQTETARDRIKRAIANLLEQGALPASTTARFHALVSYGIGGSTLYKHRDLWHPQHLSIDANLTMLETSPLETLPSDAATLDIQAEIPPRPPASHQDIAWERCEAASHASSLTSLFPQVGRNPLLNQVSSHSDFSPEVAGRNHAARLTPVQQQAFKQQAALQRQITRMQQFLDSNDPILMAEAIAWSQMYPGLLKLGGSVSE